VSDQLYKCVKSYRLGAFYNHRVVTMSNQLGKAIQVSRENAGLTQDELGSRIGVSQQTIAKWEGGKSNPRPKALDRLINELRIDGRKLREMRVSNTIDPDIGTALLADEIFHDPELGISERVEKAAIIAKAPKSFPFHSKFNPVANARAFYDAIAPIVNTEEPTSRWGVVVRTQFGPYRIDYANDELYAQFLHAPTTGALSSHLRTNIYRHLWRYTMLGPDHSKNKNYYLIIITLPEDQPLDVEPQSNTPGPTRLPYSNESALRRVTMEATTKGIYVMLARTPSKVISILTNPSFIDDPGWDYLAGPDDVFAAE
jgi:transcriptional regulator with XRE-family HTH domain